MAEPKKLITHDGTSLTIPVKPKPRLIDLLPDPREEAKRITEDGLDDRRVNDPWLRGPR